MVSAQDVVMETGLSQRIALRAQLADKHRDFRGVACYVELVGGYVGDIPAYTFLASGPNGRIDLYKD